MFDTFFDELLLIGVYIYSPVRNQSLRWNEDLHGSTVFFCSYSSFIVAIQMPRKFETAMENDPFADPEPMNISNTWPF